MLTSCSSFSPTSQKELDSSKAAPTVSLSVDSLKKFLGPSSELALADYKILKELQSGQQLSYGYLKVLEIDPTSAVVFSLNSIINSKTFRACSSEDRVALMDILYSGLTESRASRFTKCFATEGCFAALNSRDLVGQRLITSLHALSKGPIDKDLRSQRAAMVAALLEHACGLRPLDQGATNGCGPVSCLLALGNRAEIIRLVNGLCSPEGKVRLASGVILYRSKSSTRDNRDRDQGSAIRVLSSSVLNHANGSLFNYSSIFDVNHFGPVVFPGMLSAWTLQAMNDLRGEPHKILKGRQASVENIKTALENGKYVLVLRASGPTHWHWIVVRRIKGDWAYFQDPNGTPPLCEKSDLSKNKPNKISSQNTLSKYFNNNSEAKFPEKSFGPPLEAIYRVPLSALDECSKAIIVEASSFPDKN